MMDNTLSCHASGLYWDRDEDTELVCVDVREETHDIKTFTFKAKNGRYFSFEAGQYFAFEVPMGESLEQRCYSISSSPLRPQTLSITVKRVAGGLVSNWLHDTLKPGMTLAAQGPAGTFTLPKTGPEKYLFLSGGSGITPLASISQALADAARYPDVVFLHAARTPNDFAFAQELALLAKYSPNFRLFFLPENRGNATSYAGMLGRLSQELLTLAVPDIKERLVMCCGPAPFMAAAKSLCKTVGVPSDCYLEESFDAAILLEDEIESAPVDDVTSFTITFAKQNKTIPGLPDQSVLAAARKNGVRLPSSCANGMCGTCKSKLVSGSVDMKHGGGIRQREIDAGMFLPCCSKPLSDLVIDR
ncbi:hybrid-cluster NAD(P)-dependent oxidoreductase [Acetobacter cibinongensis]|uniref:Hybrid-cluster NAD(P)-dependent oxidoreductase n=1 Tax=Acetobacter cibinongensis TaxID=146475 RepID=A0A0D6N640_9PROT|nr:hybrid-cluster NAD(P)-dependent oxidoreductase [Acetobacter cibinongensis]GAN61492.1 oxidoreductase FAD-binding subunit [Acetobacter cibinongensis]GBQ14290.1 flavodoxin reductase family protein [Acetobacter cibinongensis NRIC 0482]GEL59638.1 hybrid-cluster NAD(P)-dependent oxidoreductase [Acetobacter cibinongensis]